MTYQEIEIKEAELMLKALKLVPEFQGLTINQVEQLLELIKREITNVQCFELDHSLLQARVEEWRNAYEQRRKQLDEYNHRWCD